MGKLQKVIAALESKGSTIGGLALTGFDGYVDHLAKVVNHRRQQDLHFVPGHQGICPAPVCAAGKSCDLELLPQSISLEAMPPSWPTPWVFGS